MRTERKDDGLGAFRGMLFNLPAMLIFWGVIIWLLMR